MLPQRLMLSMNPGGYASVPPKRRVAFVLAGCGARDGSEITEAVTAMVAFSQAEFAVSFFAPVRETFHVVNHTKGEEVVGARRSMLDEANRIARGKVFPLSELKASEFDILAFSGGFGVAKNLCDFAFKGSNAQLSEDVRDVIFSFIEAQKVVCAMCIAPVLLGLAARDKKLSGVRITLGTGSAVDAVAAAKSWGCEVVSCGSGEACVDSKNRFVTVPAYMVDDASPADIFACAQAMVRGVQHLVGVS
jgi:enhancing lycopene biosynthesis protein 2